MDADEIDRLQEKRTLCVNLLNRSRNPNDPLSRHVDSMEQIGLMKLVEYFDGMLEGVRVQ